MSFIFDALKKSESDRQRQNGPALFEVKVAPPRTRLPLWAVAIVALLVVNLGIVMWMVLRHAAHGAETPAPAASAASGAAPASAPALTAAVAAAPVAPGATAAAAGAPTGPAAATRLGAASSLTAPAATRTAALHEPAPAASVSEELSPDDYAPAQDSASTRLRDHVRRGTAVGVPLYQDAASTPGTQIPQLRMDLHVFATRPQDRFVMINMHKLREGDSLPEGVRVDSITPDGAVLSYNGARFLLPRE